MKALCECLLRVAGELVPQVRLTFRRKGKDDDSKCNRVCFELQRFVDSVRANEGLRTSFERIDDAKGMTLLVGLSEHEARDAVAEEVSRKARRMARKEELEME